MYTHRWVKYSPAVDLLWFSFSNTRILLTMFEKSQVVNEGHKEMMGIARSEKEVPWASEEDLATDSSDPATSNSPLLRLSVSFANIQLRINKKKTLWPGSRTITAQHIMLHFLNSQFNNAQGFLREDLCLFGLWIFANRSHTINL